MKITEIDTVPFVSHMWSAEKDKQRSSGVHLYDILQIIEKEAGRDRTRNDLTQSDLELYRGVGFLWEHILEDTLNRMGLDQPSEDDGHIIRPGEMKLDGIYLTPDAVLVPYYDRPISLEEWKCTWTSSRKPIEDKHSWWIQIQAYLHALGITTAHLRVLYINGNWSPPIPETKQYRAEFTAAELADNWYMITQTAKRHGLIQ
jgi:hypothetical protein